MTQGLAVEACTAFIVDDYATATGSQKVVALTAFRHLHAMRLSAALTSLDITMTRMSAMCFSCDQGTDHSDHYIAARPTLLTWVCPGP